MSGLLLKIALLVAMTHGIRVLGRLMGPCRSGLVMGIPSSTAIALVDCAQQRGIEPASAMAEASLLGLAAAVTVPLVFARGLGYGLRIPSAVAASVVGYVATTAILSMVHGHGPLVNFAIAVITVLTGCHFAARTVNEAQRESAPTLSWKRCLVLRTAVPIAYLVSVTVLREGAGAQWAGLMSTFPGMSLALLVVTHLEAGPAEAIRMAKALPPANLGTIAFVVAFRYGCPQLGLFWSIVAGYAVAVAMLPLVGVLVTRSSREVTGWVPAGLRNNLRLSRVHRQATAIRIAAASRVFPVQRTRPAGNGRRRLSPNLEPIGF